MSNIIDSIQLSGVTYTLSAQTSGGGVTTGEVQTMIDESISGKTNQSDFTRHTADTTIHVTTQDKTNWNAKSDFSGSYNDLTDKPTIPTVPTSNTAFTNDAGYATTGDVQTATADMATKTWVGQQGYLTEHQSLSNYYTKSETSGATQISTALASKADTATTYTKTEVDTALASKQTTLTAGTNITIVDNVISAEGGGSITIDPSLDSGSTNPVANSAITTSVNEKQFKRRYVGCGDGDAVFLSTDSVVIDGKTVTIMKPMFRGYANNSTNTGLELQNVNLGLYFTTINGKNIFNTSKNGNWITEVIETSAITTSVTSSSTDAQVPSAKAVNDKLGGLSLVKLTQAQYDALATKDSNTLYVING